MSLIFVSLLPRTVLCLLTINTCLDILYGSRHQYLSVISFFTQSIKIKSKTHQEKSARLLECHGNQRASNFFFSFSVHFSAHFSAHFFVSDTLFLQNFILDFFHQKSKAIIFKHTSKHKHIHTHTLLYINRSLN